MVRACVLKDSKSWDKYLPYAEFSYNNSYQKSLKMSPFKVLYGRKCQTPLFWNEPRKKIKSLDLKYFKKQKGKSQQKSYIDHRRRKLSFQVCDFVYLKVSPMRGLHRFKIRGKLAPRYIGSFKILEQRGEVAYQLELPPQLSDAHDVFHVSQLSNCLRVPEEQMPLEELTVGEDLTYQEYPVKILGTSKKVTQNNRYKMCKMQWSNHTEEEATLEKEDQLKVEFPDIFLIYTNLRARFILRG
jgi:hypothetical protein